MKLYTVYYSDGSAYTGQLSLKSSGTSSRGSRVRTYEVEDELDYHRISHVDVEIYDGGIRSGEDGFFILNPNSGGGNTYRNEAYAMGTFQDRDDGEYVSNGGHMPLYALRGGEKAIAAIVTGMREDTAQIITIKDHIYRFFIRFYINETVPYENIEILEYTLLQRTATYSDMAAEYRDYQLDHGFVSIKERMNEDLRYCVESLNIRIRMAWKPVPCKILEQTPENEPEVHVASSFADVETIMEAYHQLGIKKAEFCLVGWNVGGHDGRWPQILPVEESVGGLEGLKKTMALAKKYGYRITCHTNSTDAYSIADMFDMEDMAVKQNGEVSVLAERWSGGRSYNVCPKRAYEISMQTLPEVADLGFRGLHYIDVITCTSPRECFSEKHPVNRKQSGEYFDKLFAEARKLFGAVGSEGPFDYSLKNCDSTLYVSFADYKDKAGMHPLADKYIPFWQLVYHGIVLSNPYARTINSPKSEDREDFLKIVEYGGRPHVYYNAKFVTDGSDWIGDGDYRTESKEKIWNDAKGVKALAEEYDRLAYLQYEFMVRHEEVEEKVFETEYSDGTIIVCDYNTLTYRLHRPEEQ